MSIQVLNRGESCSSDADSSFELGSPFSISSPARSVSFGDVDVIEFELCAGEESSGVPESGGAALFLGSLVDRHAESLEEYEKTRRESLIKRARVLGLNIVREDELETRGREDDFFHPLTSERDRINFVRKMSPSLSPVISTSDHKKLEEIRLSRQKIYCNCTPPDKKSLKALRVLLERHNIEIPRKARTKKKRLLQMVYQRLGDRCCYDETCGCSRNGVECHEGTASGGCGCADYQSPLRHMASNYCGNEFGKYVFSQPVLTHVSHIHTK